uniref:NADH:ubiquinone oxidoreductase, NDUFB6/B17 subunit n=1 Tax=Schistocephalus solidus TaxID=70667 RepID=A0A0X3PQX4_SCHSO
MLIPRLLPLLLCGPIAHFIRMGARVDETILEMQKKLYKEELIKDLRSKHGSQFYPFCIEPMPTERDRLIKPMTDADRALRKQWLEDQKLSPREPVDVPEWTRKNIFRRVYHGFFDGFCNVFKPILGPARTKTLRLYFPKVLISYLVVCTLWYQAKYSPRTWETGFNGIRIDKLQRPSTYPGQSDFPHSPVLEQNFGDEEFSKRKIFLGDKLVTSGR